MPTHGGDFEGLPVGHSIGLTHKTQGVFHAVTLESGPPRTFVRFFERGTDVDGETEIRLSQFFDESNDIVSIVKNRRNGSRTRNTIYDGFVVSFVNSTPMHGRGQIP